MIHGSRPVKELSHCNPVSFMEENLRHSRALHTYHQFRALLRCEVGYRTALANSATSFKPACSYFSAICGLISSQLTSLAAALFIRNSASSISTCNQIQHNSFLQRHVRRTTCKSLLYRGVSAQLFRGTCIADEFQAEPHAWL